jgi:hypothetical protein
MHVAFVWHLSKKLHNYKYVFRLSKSACGWIKKNKESFIMEWPTQVKLSMYVDDGCGNKTQNDKDKKDWFM